MSSRIIYTDDDCVLVAIDDANEAAWACTFHRSMLQQRIVMLRFAQWVELVKASLLLTRAGVAHRISNITEDSEGFFVAVAKGGVHLFLDDPPGQHPVDGAIKPLPSERFAAANAAILLVSHESTGGATGAWLSPDGTPYRLASAGLAAWAIRRATVEERARGLGFVHVALELPRGDATLCVGWPEDPSLEAELVEAEARIAAGSAPRGDA